MKWEEYDLLASHKKIESDLLAAIGLKKAAIAVAVDAHPMNLAILYNGLASLLLKTGQADLAEEPARKCIELELEYGDAGRETTNLADYFGMMSSVMEAQGRFCEALEYIDKAIPIFDDLLGPDNTYTLGIKEHREYLKESCWKG
jgi:tetratricopeptide (TPR) repeat protein